MQAHHHVDRWYEEHKEEFAPPICNRLMHKEQLTVMFVGGPNTRTDFHIDEGSEFFYMLRGNMELPTIQAGKRKLVKIGEGQVFLLPSRVPHSPQRPETGSLGLVVERSRSETELDGLRWYTDFEKCEDILWERYFHCGDLGRDLVPVVQAFNASEECRTGVPGSNVVADPPTKQDFETVVPEPFDLKPWIDQHRTQLNAGADLNLFEGHPDREFRIRVIGGESTQTETWKYDTLLYQLEGAATVTVGTAAPAPLQQGECCVIPPNQEYTVQRAPGSVGLAITQDPAGNKK
eukprot:CAMPEP_0114560602 /NCGR_PEP_ID=MMETSP0114-20121206/11546_1 /TAXON_ID=31324 /ORGANISM="Goniomonas sp, Strain m" /LENGTH=290 /DNA_ID=CAMNT_0001746157 /DNA_START=6 /DNA_END=878 /DNA_ORIENTATION=+